MAKIGLVISDIDGTILDKDHQLDSRLKENLAILAQQGILFCLASARSPLGIRPIQEALGLDAPLVAYNGALIGQWQEGEFRVLQDIPIVEADVAALIGLIEHSFPAVSIGLYVVRIGTWLRGISGWSWKPVSQGKLLWLRILRHSWPKSQSFISFC